MELHVPRLHTGSTGYARRVTQVTTRLLTKGYVQVIATGYTGSATV